MKTRNGQEYSKRVDFPYGHPKKPINREGLIEKFRDCASHSAKRLTAQEVEKIITMVNRLEEIDDVSTVAQLLG